MRRERQTGKLFVDENVPGRWRSASSQALSAAPEVSLI
jgi:hypothetical protein